MPFGNMKIYFRGYFQLRSQFKNYNPSRNLKFDNLGIFQSLKLLTLMENNISVSLMLAPNTLDCYGFNWDEGYWSPTLKNKIWLFVNSIPRIYSYGIGLWTSKSERESQSAASVFPDSLSRTRRSPCSTQTRTTVKIYTFLFYRIKI